MKKELSGKKGQSLIEILVALGIALLIIVALVGVTVTSIRNASFARNHALATRYAQEWIEEARKLRDEEPNNFFTSNYCDSFGNDPDGRGIFTRERDCTLSENGEKKTMRVVVTVRWVDSAGPHESRLETRLTNWK